MKTISLVLGSALLLFAFACGDNTPPQSPASASAPQAAPTTGTAPATASQAACTPNVGSSCVKDSDCAQCALVPPRTVGPREVISTTVQCVNATCTKTGCPKDPCPQGQMCQGCVANLPCSCVSAPGH